MDAIPEPRLPAKPADWDSYLAAMRAKLTEPGRMAEFMKTFKPTPADPGEQLANVQYPALIIMGTADPDFAHPNAEGETANPWPELKEVARQHHAQ